MVSSVLTLTNVIEKHKITFYTNICARTEKKGEAADWERMNGEMWCCKNGGEKWPPSPPPKRAGKGVTQENV